MREVELAFNGLVDEIAPGFGGGAEVHRDLLPTHLQHWWYHQLLGLPGGLGITYKKLHFPSSYARILQNPSNRSTLVSMAILYVPTKLMSWWRRKEKLSISLNNASGANLYIISLTLAWIGSAPFLACTGNTGKDTSKTVRTIRFVCGTTAMGDTFNLLGLSLYTSSQG